MDHPEHDAGTQIGKMFQRVGSQGRWRRGCAIEPQNIVHDLRNIGSVPVLFVVGVQINRRGNRAARALNRQSVQGDTVVFGERPKRKLIRITQCLLQFVCHCFKKSFVYHKIPPLKYKMRRNKLCYKNWGHNKNGKNRML